MRELDECTFTPNIVNDNSMIKSTVMLRANIGINDSHYDRS